MAQHACYRDERWQRELARGAVLAKIASQREAARHFQRHSAAAAARVLCVYDNAGESFLPGADTAASPVTRHLAQSRVLLFLFDPTQDMRFRRLCRGTTNDPQMLERSERLERERPVRQETILAEAAQRVRRSTGLRSRPSSRFSKRSALPRRIVHT